MDVSEKVKEAYRTDSITKHVTLTFPELSKEIETEKLHSETMKLSEALLEKDNIEFVGCIASKFQIRVQGLSEDIKGKKIEVSVCTDGTEDEPVPIFHGIVDSALKQSNKQVKEIVAYDELYTKGNIDVATWYKALPFPVTIKEFRDSLFQYIGLSQVEISLPNDSISIERKYDPNTLQTLQVIKAICQINGAFGIVNREGMFEYRILAQRISDVSYPAITLFPSTNLFPADPDVALAAAERYAETVEAEHFTFYKTLRYEEFEVKPVDRLTIRQTEKDAGVSYGTGSNNYIIQGNMFTYGLPSATLKIMAENVYQNVQGFSYYPFDSDNNGLPFLECGDAVSYTMIDWEETEKAAQSGDSGLIYRQQSFYILNREMSGIQALRDSYKANGEEYQNEFITDLQMSINMLKQNESGNDSRLDDIDARLEELESGGIGGGGFNVVSVAELPADTDPNTIYLIQGVIVVE